MNTYEWVARDSSGILSSFHFERRANDDNDITIKILFCGICYSDLHFAKNEAGMTSYPFVPRHEIVGEVTKVGHNVTKFKIGDKAGVGCMVGSCENCKQDLEVYCPEMIWTLKTFGGYSENIVIDEHFAVLLIVNDVRFTVTQAVEPMEKGFTRFGEKLHKISQNIKKNDKDRRRTKDDSCVATSSPTRRMIRGIDDPLLIGSVSDSGVSRGRKHHRRKSGNTSAESGGESSSDQCYGGYLVRGRRWVTKE